MIRIFILLGILQICVAPPTREKQQESNEKDGLEDVVEYHRYIKEVVKLLESDPTFREKLNNAKEPDIKSGKIADDLELVSHHVRTQLDEVKRIELQRLKHLAAQRDALMNNEIDQDDPLHHHIDAENKHTFEIEDLKRLIIKTTKDIAEADLKRREQFKEYELQKEYEKMEKLNHTTGEEHEKLEKEYREREEKHKKHEKLHTPGHKQQLEEVWKEQDHMTQEFNPKVFFMLHDLDGNGLWDQEEVKALFIKELDKMYAAGAPEDDMVERIEEMERMREAVFDEIDLNKDGFIDYNEFLHQTKRTNFQKDPGWSGLDEQRPFTNDELDEYVRQHQLNMQQAPYYGHHPQMQYPQGYYPPQGQMPQQQYPQGHMPPQGYNGQVPAGQMHQQGYNQQMRQQAQGQMHQQGYHQQMPQQAQGQFHPGQLPQAQVNPQQIPNHMYPDAPVKSNDPKLNTNEIHRGSQQPQHNPQLQQGLNEHQNQVPVAQVKSHPQGNQNTNYQAQGQQNINNQPQPPPVKQKPYENQQPQKQEQAPRV